MMQRFLLVVVVSILSVFPQPAEAKHKQYEKWYQAQWCAEHGGKSEVLLPDQTRCDCETVTHVIEFDFGPKWSEAIGQALYYAVQLNKPAAVVLILESQKDYTYWVRLNTTVQHFQLPITTWKIENF